ncbi:MAG: FAD-dependent oxidoreductase, partial [Alicyclobacillus sp.]|nr:FAD-dependent oxidoreductase [Alicyclobacillus sp.]
AQLGWRVAVVERAELGCTCLHRGCIPSKSLLRTAELLVQARSAAAFGVEHSAPVLNLARAHERKDKTIQQLHQGVQGLLKRHGIEVIRGSGRVLGPSIFSPQAGAVAVEMNSGEQLMLVPRFTLLATGAAPRCLPGWTFDGQYVLSSDHALQRTALPQSAVIVGGGAIGVEWASLWSDFGVQVTLLEAQPQILPQEDAEVAEAVARSLRQRGVRILTQCTVLTDTLAVDGGISFAVRSGETQTDVRAEVVLVAVGRAPVTDGLGLEATEVRLNSEGAVVVDEHYRTAEPSIFAVGDVIGGLQLAHVAAHEALHAVEVMAGRTPRPLDYTAMPRCTYSRPEVASTGLTEAQARARGLEVRVGKFPFRANGKAVLMGE